jgi:hypothetical protein
LDALNRHKAEVTITVDFWPLLKAEKVLPLKQFWQEKNFFKILFSIIHMNP